MTTTFFLICPYCLHEINLSDGSIIEEDFKDEIRCPSCKEVIHVAMIKRRE